MSQDTLVNALDAVAAELASVDMDDVEAASRRVAELFPLDGPAVTNLRRLAKEGMNEGWLLPKENGDIRFGRVVKDLHGFTVDAVLMHGPGPRHRHPNGEIDLCFALDGAPTFDGRPEGWTLYGPDSTHVPTVEGGTMLILYFLPGGAIEFL